MKAVWIFWAVLLDAFKSERPSPGERIGIRRLDDAEGQHGSYRRFTLIVEHRGGEVLPDFDTIAPPPDAGGAVTLARDLE